MDGDRLADQLVETAEALANRWDADGPQVLAELAECLLPGNGWTLLAIARETLRTLVIADPLDDPAVSVALGWVTAALRIRGAIDIADRPANLSSCWRPAGRVTDDAQVEMEWEPSWAAAE